MGRVPVGPSEGHTALMSILHLAARFFTSLRRTPPTATEQSWVNEQLTTPELALWSQMSAQDRRHSALVGRRFAEARPEATTAEIAGALLHDVGKIECRLGTFGRVAATIVGPRGQRFTSYHEHESIGARMAQAVGSDPATVELIAGSGPAFEALEASDHA